MATNYSPKIVTDGLVLCLDAANPKSYPGSGTTWTDLSKNGNNGTLENGVGYSSDDKGVLTFDGVSDRVNLSGYSQWNMFRSVTSDDDDFSISCTVKPTSIGSDQALFSQRHGDRMSLWLMSNGKVTLEMDDTRDYVGTTTVLENNIWYVIDVVFYNNTSSSFVEYYVNGNFERSETKWDGSGSVAGTALWIGWQARTTYPENPGYFAGNVSNVRVYNRALTADEIQQNYNATRGRYGI